MCVCVCMSGVCVCRGGGGGGTRVCVYEVVFSVGRGATLYITQ